MDLTCWQAAESIHDTISTIQVLAKQPECYALVPQITTASKALQETSRLLREISDLSLVYHIRIVIIRDWIKFFLDCLKATLKELRFYLDDVRVGSVGRWVNACAFMVQDAEGISLRGRFERYSVYLLQVVRLLSRPDLFESDPARGPLTMMLKLKMKRNPKMPVLALNPPMPPVMVHAPKPEHWAELVFEDLPARPTRFGGPIKVAQCFADPVPPSNLDISAGSLVLFKLQFNQNLFSLTCFSHPDEAENTRFLARWRNGENQPCCSVLAASDLCFYREKSSLLVEYWDEERREIRDWCVLGFGGWERLVLVHATLLALKARHPLTTSMDPSDYSVQEREACLFQQEIIDDEYAHDLTIWEDRTCFGLRITAAIKGDEDTDPILIGVIVWTAFFNPTTTQVYRASAHKIHLLHLKLHVFCDQDVYDDEEQQRIGVRGERYFEIRFLHVQAADKFMDLIKVLGRLRRVR